MKALIRLRMRSLIRASLSAYARKGPFHMAWLIYIILCLFIWYDRNLYSNE